MTLTARKFYKRGFLPSPAQETEFFRNIKLENGTFKRTSDGRMDDLNDRLIDVLGRMGRQPQAFLDVGVSSGISTLELLFALKGAAINASVVATDIQLMAKLDKFHFGFDALVSPDGFPLQFGCLGFAVRPWTVRRDLLTGYPILSCIARRYYRLLKTIASSRKCSEEILLLSPRMSRCPEISCVEEDIFSPNIAEFTSRFDVIRAANILNKNYFSDAKLCLGIENLKSYLIGPGCFLVVNRTHEDSTNHATIFVLSEERSFEVVDRVGNGSEIENLVLGRR